MCRQSPAAFENGYVRLDGIRLRGNEPVLRVDGAKLCRLAPKTPKQPVGVAPAVMGGVRSRPKVIDVHCWTAQLQFAWGEQIDDATLRALERRVFFKKPDMLRRQDKKITDFNPATGRQREQRRGGKGWV